MKNDILKEGIGYRGPTELFKKNIKYSNIVKEFGSAIKEKGLNEAFHDEYLYHEESYDEERFRIINKLATRPKLTVLLSESDSPVLFEGYSKAVVPKEDQYLDEGVADVLRKVIDWIGDKFAFVFMRGSKRKELAQKAAEDLKENPNELPDKISAAMKAHKDLPQTSISNIRPAVEVGKQQALGNNQAAHDYVNTIKQPVIKNESFKKFEKSILTEAPTITASTTDPVSSLLIEIWKFIGNVPFIGMVLQGVLGYMGPMLLSIMISQIIQRAMIKGQQQKQQAAQAH